MHKSKSEIARFHPCLFVCLFICFDRENSLHCKLSMLTLSVTSIKAAGPSFGISGTLYFFSDERYRGERKYSTYPGAQIEGVAWRAVETQDFAGFLVARILSPIK